MSPLVVFFDEVAPSSPPSSPPAAAPGMVPELIEVVLVSTPSTTPYSSWTPRATIGPDKNSSKARFQCALVLSLETRTRAVAARNVNFTVSSGRKNRVRCRFNETGVNKMTSVSTSDPTDHGVTRLTLSRAPVNALNPGFLDDITGKLVEIENDEDTRVLLIASGLSVFSAGVDLKEAQAFTASDQTQMVDALNTMLAKLYAMPKPVIVAVNGAAIAGGLFLVLASDYSVAREGAVVGLTEVRVGVNFPVAPLEVARATLAPGAFRRMLLGGRNIDAASALNMGVLDEVVTRDQLMSRAEEVAADYATIPPTTFARVKVQMRSESLRIINDAIEKQSDPVRPAWFSEETSSAMSALLESAARK